MLRIILAFLLMTSQAWAVTQFDKTLPSSGANLTAWPAAVQAQWSIFDTLLSNYKRGMILTYKNVTTLAVAAGECVVSNSGASARLFLQNAANADITSANLDSGASFSNSTTYYVYAGTSTATAASATYYISLSSTAPTGVTYYLQLGSFTTDGSANVVSPAISIATVPGVQTQVSKSIGTIYQALTDGFATASCKSDGGGNGTLTLYSDASASPSTAVAVAPFTNVAGTTGGSVGYLVKKYNYYQAVSSNCGTSQIMYFSPMGS